METTNYETQENNKIIAEFMGLKPRLISPDVYGYSDGTFFSCTHDTPEKVVESISKYVKYHSDWNWLMQVVEKIEALLAEVEIRNQQTRIIGYNNEIIQFHPSSKITSVYTAVVNFIKWYNANK